MSSTISVEDVLQHKLATDPEFKAAYELLGELGVDVLLVDPDDETPENLGMDVYIKFSPQGLFASGCGRHGVWDEILHNVTEVHYAYDNAYRSGGESLRVAFEAHGTHGTGINYDLSDLLEFEAVLATEFADSF